MTRAVVQNHGAGRSESVLEADHGRHSVAQPVIVQAEEHVGGEQEPVTERHLHADCTAQGIERVLRETDRGKRRPIVERAELLGAKPLCVDDEPSKYIEGERQARVCADIRTDGVRDLIRKIARSGSVATPWNNTTA